MVPVLSRSREFSLFLDGTGTGTGKNWSRKKVPVTVPEKNLGTVTLWSEHRLEHLCCFANYRLIEQILAG